MICFYLSFRAISAKEENEENQNKTEEKGLGLEDTVNKVVKKKVVKNYHLEEMFCEDCHSEQPSNNETNETVKLVDEDVNIICNKCHEKDNIHPVAVSPNEEKKASNFLPLGSRGDLKGKVTCATCHDVHLKDAYNYLLRDISLGNKKDDKDQKGEYFKIREELCDICHDKNFVKESPHNNNKYCKFCHYKDPKEVLKIEDSFNRDIVKICNFCHSKRREAHYLAVNPFYDKELKKEIYNFNIRLINDKIVCVSCHDPHGGNKVPHALKENYIALSEKSKRINPHWKGTFCLSCHKKEEKKLGFKFDGDFNKICNWCHETKEARANTHPVGIVPRKRENLKISKEFPLQEGRITCVTCHDVRKQEKFALEDKDKNPNFLIGAPYKDKNEMCFLCHIQKKFSAINAHDQITDEGEIKEDNCIICHTTNPNRDVEGLEDIDPTIEDLTYLCSRCHENRVHPANTNHLMEMPKDKYSKKLQYESIYKVVYPLDARGKIYCGTCHSIHESGVVKSKKASKGSDLAYRIRLPLLNGELCLACHEKEKSTIEMERRYEKE